MSYILDALDKAERERKRGQPAAQHTSERPAAESGPRSPWLWVAVFAVIFNALLAGLLIYSSTRDSKEIKTASLPPPIVETPPITPTTPPAVAPAAPALVPAPSSLPSPSPSPTPTPAPELQIHRATPPAVAPTVLLMTDQELQAQARQLEMDRAPAIDSPPAEQLDPTPPITTPAPAPTETPLEMIPLLVEMSQQLQQSLPPFRVDVHVHASKMENRFVMINLRRYREGDEVAPGLTLERITKEGMVLKFRGERFRYLMRT